jgi:hypothetical protein
MRADLDEERQHLELALLRRGMHARDAQRERCGECGRTPLIGERVHVFGDGAVVCELCRILSDRPGGRARVVHGPEYGHTMKIVDRRVA